MKFFRFVIGSVLILLTSCKFKYGVRKDIAFYEPMGDKQCLTKAINSAEGFKVKKVTEERHEDDGTMWSLNQYYHKMNFTIEFVGSTRSVTILRYLSPQIRRESDHDLMIETYTSDGDFTKEEREFHDKALERLRSSILKTCGPLR